MNEMNEMNEMNGMNEMYGIASGSVANEME
jgi:hypothetical protein